MAQGRSLAAALVLRLGVYLLIAIAGLALFPPLLYLFGILVAAALGTFAAAAVANTITMRIFERAGLFALGFNWNAASARNLLLGLAAGAGAALVVLGLPLVFGGAHFVRDAAGSSGVGSLLFTSVVLLFGAAGEELLFRGYPFQLLAGRLGHFAIILPSSVLFALAHSSNQNVSLLGLINTAGFGVVLGYSMVRSGDLWMPTGLHFAWNWVLPLAGVNLSGFTMGVSGYTMRWTAGELWSGGAYGPEASLLTSAVIVGLMFYVHKAPVVEQKPLLLEPGPEA